MYRRVHVPDDRVSWDTEFPGYAPISFTSDDSQEGEDWEAVRDQMSRRLSYEKLPQGLSHLDEQGTPRNPHGRTGIVGRGMWKRWGPNPCVHIILTRYRPVTSEPQVWAMRCVGKHVRSRRRQLLAQLGLSTNHPMCHRSSPSEWGTRSSGSCLAAGWMITARARIRQMPAYSVVWTLRRIG
jgi:hypothetical protein